MTDDRPSISWGLGPPDEKKREPKPLSRFQRRVARWIHSVWIGFVTIPDKTVEDIDTFLDPTDRRDMVRSLKEHKPLTKRQRRALITMTVWTLVLLWAFATIVLLSFDPDSVDRFQAAYVLAAYSFATSLFLPMPYELLLQKSAGVIGPWWAVVVSSVSKAFGTLIILTLGSSAHAILETLVSRNPTAVRVFDGLNRLAGHPLSLVVVFVLFAIPFNSDTLILYLLAPLGVRRIWMVVVSLGAFVVRGAFVLFIGGAFG